MQNFAESLKMFVAVGLPQIVFQILTIAIGVWLGLKADRRFR